MSKVILLIVVFKILVVISLAYIASLLDMSCACGSRVWTRDRRGRFCAVCGEPWGEQYSADAETVSDSKPSLFRERPDSDYPRSNFALRVAQSHAPAAFKEIVLCWIRPAIRLPLTNL